MAAWTKAYVDSLPDSSFLFIGAGGEKDDTDKTTPRSLRKLPYKDDKGVIDHANLVNAESRLDQTEGIPADEKATIKAKIEKLLGKDDKTKMDRHGIGGFRIVPVKLDANGDLPTRIPLFVTGNWPNSVKGNFVVNKNDLSQIKQHYDAKIGFPTDDATTGLAIDFMHEYDGPAAAWMRGLELEEDPNSDDAVLYANPVEWTSAGQQAVQGGMFKCISPMGAFGSRDEQPIMWQKPTDLTVQFANVLEGAGLTNIPFLQGMSPIRASALADEDQLQQGGMFFVKDKEERYTMNLDAIIVMENKDVTAEQRAYLQANKSKLSAEVVKKFELDKEVETISDDDKALLAALKAGTKKVVESSAALDTTSADDKALLAAVKDGTKKVVDAAGTTTLSRDALSAEDRQLLDSLKSGDKKLVDAATVQKLDRLDGLMKMEDDYLHDKAKTTVLSHIKRGAVKPDQLESTANMLLALTGDARKSFEAHLSALPSNELLAGEVGHNQEVTEDIETELKTKTLAHKKAAEDAGRKLTYGEAQGELLKRDADLRTRYAATTSNK